MSSAAAAAAHIRMLHEEEESMSAYAAQDLAHYEFKILRANTAAFRDPDTLQKVCQEESIAGWSLVEKFDNCRLRFKRPITARNTTTSSDIDPYRTTYGISSGALTAIILSIVFGGIFLFILVVASLSH